MARQPIRWNARGRAVGDALGALLALVILPTLATFDLYLLGAR